jgi:hypothetical protein
MGTNPVSPRLQSAAVRNRVFLLVPMPATGRPLRVGTHLIPLVPTLRVGTHLIPLVPTLRVGTQPRTLCVPPRSRDIGSNPVTVEQR